MKVFKGISKSGHLSESDIASRIRRCMAEYKISQEGLAKACGCSTDKIYAYVNRKRLEENMDITVLKKIAAYFGKAPYYFCNEYLEFIDTQNVSAILKAMRKARQFTQRQFAELYDIPLIRYKGYENGKVQLQFPYWKRIFAPSEF